MQSTEPQRQVRVVIQASDPISHAGITCELASRAEVTSLPLNRRADADVVIVAVAHLTSDVLSAMHRAAEATNKPVVLITDDADEADLHAMVECRTVAVLPRAAATGDRLLRSVLAAASTGNKPPDEPMAELLKNMELLRKEMQATQENAPASLNLREVEVLRLVSEGFETAEIAGQLCYSERTVKNVIYAITNRLNLRNRQHAVAYALRAGVI